MDDAQKKQLSLQQMFKHSMLIRSEQPCGTALFAMGKTSNHGFRSHIHDFDATAIGRVSKSLKAMTADLMAMDKAAKVTHIGTTALGCDGWPCGWCWFRNGQVPTEGRRDAGGRATGYTGSRTSTNVLSGKQQFQKTRGWLLLLT